MEPQPPSPALSIKVMPPEPLPKGSARCLDPHSRAMVSGAGGCGFPPGPAGPGTRGRSGPGVPGAVGIRRDPLGRGLRGRVGPGITGSRQGCRGFVRTRRAGDDED